VVDLYFKVDQKSRKEKNQSYIYLLISTGENSFVSSESEPKAFTAGNKFLDSFIEYSATYKMDVDIQNQEETVRTAEKKYNKLKEEEKDLEEKLRNNRVQQENQEKLIAAERKKLEELKLKKQTKVL
jgi:valyl-tRNA synthetase